MYTCNYNLGDSGGPLVCRSRDQIQTDQCILSGVTSWGFGCGNTAGVYSNIPKYLQFIYSEGDF